MASCARFLLWLSMVLCLFAVFPSRAQELSVEASVDASRISVDDVVTLVISVSGRNLEDAPEPSLPALNDFLIVGRSSATSSNFSLSNGQVNTSQTIQYIYQLQPRQTGKFVIGTASVAYGGRTYRTTPFTIEVTQGQTGGQRPSSGTSPGQNAPPGKTTYAKDDMFLRAIIDKKQAFAGEQITVVYKLFTRVELTTAQYDRLPSYTGFWVEEFFSAKHLEYKQEIVDGKRYATAILKQIALFPTVTGEQQIEPLTMLCDVPAGGKNLIDSFFNDPFFSRTHQVSIQTEPQTVEVVPLPASGQPRGFGGAVGQFSIRSFVDQTKAEVNQPVTMTVEVSGTGNIKTLGEPVLPDLAVFKRYASESRDEIAPNNQQIAGKKIFTHVLIPLHPGEQRIAPASFVFFDPVSRAYKTVTTTPLVLSVEPGRDGGGVAGVMPQKTAVSQMRQDIQYIKPETVSLEDQGTALYGSLWYILLHLIPAAAAGAALFYRSHADRLVKDVGYARWRRAYSEARRELEEAEKALQSEQLGQVFAHISHALYRYIGNKSNQPTAGLTTTQITELLAARQIDEETISGVRQCLEACDMARFAPTLLSEQSAREVLAMTRQTIETLEQRIAKTR